MSFRALTLAAGLCLALSSPLAAQTRHDAQLWVMFLDTHALSENWRLHLELQPRWSQDMSELDQTLYRWAVGRRINRALTLWGGHVWVPRTLGEGTRHEHRAWQQASITLPTAGKWAPSIRLRNEQRFLDGWADSSHRLRAMLRGVHPIADGTWSAVIWDEFMVNYDKTAGGPGQGFDQNRIFAGVLRRLNAKAGLEFGYLLQTPATPTTPTQQNHVGFVWLNLAY